MTGDDENAAGWTISIDATSEPGILADGQLEQLVDAFAPEGGALSYLPGRLGVTFSLYATNKNDALPLDEVASHALDRFFKHLAILRQSDTSTQSEWQPVSLEVRTFAEHDREHGG